MITEGENSNKFYFFTLPSSIPADLECKAESHALSLQWTDPTIGMVENVTYHYIKQNNRATKYPSGIIHML